jgi:hypothetical protein
MRTRIPRATGVQGESRRQPPCTTNRELDVANGQDPQRIAADADCGWRAEETVHTRDEG